MAGLGEPIGLTNTGKCLVDLTLRVPDPVTSFCFSASETADAASLSRGSSSGTATTPTSGGGTVDRIAAG